VCARVCVSTRGHFRSRDKDGGHTIRSAVAENPMLHANLVALCFDLDLDLDPMTFIYESDPYSLEIYQICKYKLPISSFQKLSSDKQARHDRNYIPLSTRQERSE